MRTLTTHVDEPNPFGPAVEAFPYDFERPEALEASLRGATTLFGPGSCRVQPVFVEDLAAAVGSRARSVRVPPALGVAAGKLVGLFLGDVVLTRDGLRGSADRGAGPDAQLSIALIDASG